MEIQNYFYNLPDDLQQKIFKYVYDGCMKDLKGSNVIKLYTLYDTIKRNRYIDYCMYEEAEYKYKRLNLKEYTTDNDKLNKIKYISFGLPTINKEGNPIYHKAFYDNIKTIIKDEIELLKYNLCMSVYRNTNGYLRVRDRNNNPVNIIKAEYIDNNFNVYFKDPMRCNADIAINIINGYSFVKYIIDHTYQEYFNTLYDEDKRDLEDLGGWLENHRFLEGWEIGKKGKGRYIRIDPYFGS